MSINECPQERPATPNFKKVVVDMQTGSMRTVLQHLDGRFFRRQVPTDANNESGYGLMHGAAEHKRDLIPALLERGVAAETRTEDDVTPFMLLAENARDGDRSPEYLRLLKAHGATVDAQGGAMHEAALHRACRNGGGYLRTEVIESLLQLEADPRLENKEGQQAVDIIRQDITELRTRLTGGPIKLWGIDLSNLLTPRNAVVYEKIERCKRVRDRLLEVMNGLDQTGSWGGL